MADGTDAARTMKRRGILAAAGAIVAGIMAKGTSQPVRASTDTNFSASGGSGVAYFCGPGYTNGVFVSASSTGVYSQSTGNHAVLGSLNAPASGKAGVYGVGNGSGTFGVLGDGSGGGIGVQGQNGTVGVLGKVTSAAANTIAVFGNNLSTGANGIGIYGSSVVGTGVYGQTSASYQYGVLGTTYAPTSTAVAGTCTGDGSSAFSGGTGNPNAFAAYFQGHVQIDGPFDVIGAGNKHAAVAHPDGSHRTIYSIEAAEAWVEDFGTGTLAGGQASVKLDPDFAALIHTDEYHVFLTSHGDYHIHTPQRGVSGFTVQVTSGAGKAASGTTGVTGTFSWRVVARPKTTAKVGRLAKVNIADAKALLPDPAKLPKPPETPKAAVPKP